MQYSPDRSFSSGSDAPPSPVSSVGSWQGCIESCDWSSGTASGETASTQVSDGEEPDVYALPKEASAEAGVREACAAEIIEALSGALRPGVQLLDPQMSNEGAYALVGLGVGIVMAVRRSVDADSPLPALLFFVGDKSGLRPSERNAAGRAALGGMEGELYQPSVMLPGERGTTRQTWQTAKSVRVGLTRGEFVDTAPGYSLLVDWSRLDSLSQQLKDVGGELGQLDPPVAPDEASTGGSASRPPPSRVVPVIPEHFGPGTGPKGSAHVLADNLEAARKLSGHAFNVFKDQVSTLIMPP